VTRFGPTRTGLGALGIDLEKENHFTSLSMFSSLSCIWYHSAAYNHEKTVKYLLLESSRLSSYKVGISDQWTIFDKSRIDTDRVNY